MNTGEVDRKATGELDWTWEEIERQRDCSLRWDSSAMAYDNGVDDWTWEEIERQRDCSARWDAGAIPTGSPVAAPRRFDAGALLLAAAPAPQDQAILWDGGMIPEMPVAADPDDQPAARIRRVRGGGL